MNDKWQGKWESAKYSEGREKKWARGVTASNQASCCISERSGFIIAVYVQEWGSNHNKDKRSFYSLGSLWIDLGLSLRDTKQSE